MIMCVYKHSVYTDTHRYKLNLLAKHNSITTICSRLLGIFSNYPSKTIFIHSLSCQRFIIKHFFLRENFANFQPKLPRTQPTTSLASIWPPVRRGSSTKQTALQIISPECHGRFKSSIKQDVQSRGLMLIRGEAI